MISSFCKLFVRYQGWGQIQLSNVLPLSPGDAMDLYVADQEMLTSFTKRFYYVEVNLEE